MGVIAWIVVGLIAGFLATRITGAQGGMFRNIAIGLVGAILGGFLATKLGLQVVPDFWGSSSLRPSARLSSCSSGRRSAAPDLDLPL